MYKRDLYPHICEWLFQEKIIILYGARQVGKTTLSKQILKEYEHTRITRYFNGEDILVQQSIINKSADQIALFFEDADLVVLDEAQTIPNIGRILKVFHDAYPNIQIIATGSSSFDLASSINEPLTGRSIEFTLYPLSFTEITKESTVLQKKSTLSERITYGMYPEIVSNTYSKARKLLENITNNYLFKDILSLEGIKNTPLVYKILKALAYQIGSEVSYQEISRLVGSSQHTVEKYIDILEKAFIIFRLHAYSTNQRKEIRKSQKVYFYDTGIRNALLDQFDDIELRNDKGALFENFVLLELMKEKENTQGFAQFYFWRTYDQQEVDIVKVENGIITAIEVKWNPRKKQSKKPVFWGKTYPKSDFTVITFDSFCGA